MSISSVVTDELNAHIAQGHALLIYLRLDHALHIEGEEEKQEDRHHLIKKVGLQAVEFTALKRALKVDDEATALLLSPTGKVLSSSTNLADVEKEAERFEVCVAMAVIENSLEEVPVRRTADEWIKVCAEQNESAFTVLQRLTQAENNISGPASANAKPVQNSLETSFGHPVQAATPSEGSSTGRKGGKATKIAIRFSNGAPRQIIEIDNTATTRLRDLTRRISMNVDSLVVEYPRKELTLTEHGSLTLDELDLNTNPSLVAKVAGSSQSGLMDRRSPGAKSITDYLGEVVSFLLVWFMWLVGLVKPVFQPRLVAPPEAVRSTALRGRGDQNQEQEKRKPNQYWNGDSTVFESPDDGSPPQ